MCWFSGIYSKKNNLENKKLIKESIKKISHRWEKENFLEKENYFFWYLRLPTDDINYDKKDYLNNILYNWIIYNTEFLKEKFNLDSKNFDSLILEEWYKKCSKKFLEKIRWMFAFAFDRGKTIELVRDTIWIKPLYYTFWENFFAFSSEIKWLIDICKKNNSKIIEVLPWEIIIFDKENFIIKKEKFFYKKYTNFENNFDYIEESLKTCLINPTKKYLNSWKKIAILLSWWLDSSVLVYSLFKNKQINHKNIEVFSMWLENSKDNYYTKIIEKDLKIKVNYIEPLSEEESINILEKIVYISESFLSRVLKVSLFQYSLAKKIREKWIDIVISGEGSDEIFFWYDRFYKNKNDKEIINFFEIFFKKVFFYTLLQRLDRTFSYFTIESRVPFLDQELVENISKLDINYKLKNKIINKSWYFGWFAKIINWFFYWI